MTDSEILTLKDIKDAQEKISHYLNPSPLFKTEIFIINFLLKQIYI
jgi:hypothetical protein